MKKKEEYRAYLGQIDEALRHIMMAASFLLSIFTPLEVRIQQYQQIFDSWNSRRCQSRR
jgi:hypothetical protein